MWFGKISNSVSLYKILGQNILKYYVHSESHTATPLSCPSLICLSSGHSPVVTLRSCELLMDCPDVTVLSPPTPTLSQIARSGRSDMLSPLSCQHPDIHQPLHKHFLLHDKYCQVYLLHCGRSCAQVLPQQPHSADGHRRPSLRHRVLRADQVGLVPVLVWARHGVLVRCGGRSLHNPAPPPADYLRDGELLQGLHVLQDVAHQPGAGHQDQHRPHCHHQLDTVLVPSTGEANLRNWPGVAILCLQECLRLWHKQLVDREDGDHEDVKAVLMQVSMAQHSASLVLNVMVSLASLIYCAVSSICCHDCCCPAINELEQIRWAVMVLVRDSKSLIVFIFRYEQVDNKDLL